MPAGAARNGAPMIDRRHIGKTLAPATLEVEKGRLRFFAEAIGETNPIYTDEAAAQAAGYPSLPAPPTFIMAGELDADTIRTALVEMGVDINRILHGEQQFTFHAPVCAGDTITFASTFSDIYGRRNGGLEFIVKETTMTNQHGAKVADARSVIVVRGA
jgi:acyl dehydratase